MVQPVVQLIWHLVIGQYKLRREICHNARWEKSSALVKPVFETHTDVSLMHD